MRLRQVKLSSKTPSRKRVALTVTGLLLFSVLVTLHIVSGRHSATAANPPALLDELQIELTSNGFTPSAVQRGAGTFGITVENSAISGEYTLRLKAADGTVVKEVPVQKGSAAWTVTLEPGQYTLTEANNPQWQCQITVQ